MTLTAPLDPRQKLLLLQELDNRIRRAESKERLKEEAEGRLLPFIRLMWPFVEPARKLVEGWPLDAICEHLEAVTAGEITRLLINVPPGYMKSLVANVFWPAWEWIAEPSLRYIAASYSGSLTIRDNTRFRNVITSPLYRDYWGDRFEAGENVTKITNDKTGWKLATSVTGVGTGERGDRFIIDDGNSVRQAESEAVTTATNQWFREVVPTRLNDAVTGVIINIQQRTSELDISGTILDPENGMSSDYVHLMIAQEYDSTRHCVTVIGWEDPRGADPVTRDANDGALAWAERFPRSTVEREKDILGEYAASGQFQQRPVPRGGGIFKREHWKEWPPLDWPGRANNATVILPPFSYVVASLDTALSQKQTADYSALTIWGIWRGADASRLLPRIVTNLSADSYRLDDAQRAKCMLIYAWEKRLRLHGPPEEIPPGMSKQEWMLPARLAERQKNWGLVQWTVHDCRRWRVDSLLIEVKANGKDVGDELERLHKAEDWGTIMVDPGAYDKVSRAYALQHLWENGVVYAPLVYAVEDDTWGYPAWAQKVVDQFTIFPRGKHDDLVDSGMHALKHMRDLGLLVRTDEEDRSLEEELEYSRPGMPLYPA